VLIGDGHGGLQTAPGSSFATGKGAWRLAVTDLNGDGKPDIFASGVEDNLVTVLLGRWNEAVSPRAATDPAC
jgi:hypothetical protein